MSGAGAGRYAQPLTRKPLLASQYGLYGLFFAIGCISDVDMLKYIKNN
jgi:hypothetical protein